MNKIINSLLKSKDFNNELIIKSSYTHIYKYLFYSRKKENNNKILEILLQNWIKDINKIYKIFDIFYYTSIHFWIDLKTKKLKIYISLYNESFQNSLKIIKTIKDIIWIKDKYFLEKDFYKFDCIWIDILEKWFDLKIYELIKINNNFNWLLDFIKREDVKEIWYLKNFKWRRKKFFRFKKYQNIKKFNDIFDLNILNELKIFVFLEKKVKYYCIEWNKKEIYFI